MSKLSTGNREVGSEDQQHSAGIDFYNPGAAAWARKVGRDLQKKETFYNQGEGAATDHTREQIGQLETLRTNENNSFVPFSISRRTKEEGRTDGIKNLLNRKRISKKSSSLAVLLLLLGGGGFLTVFLSPNLLGAVNFKEVLSRGLNDQLHSLDTRSRVLLRAKMKDATSGSCGAVKIRCKFATISDKQVDKFKQAGINMELDRSVGFGSRRGQIKSISFKDSSGQTLEITKASQLQDALVRSGNMEFRAAMLKGYNPFFAGFTDKVALGVMRSLKVSKHLVTTGTSDEERQKKINAAVSGIEDPNARPISTIKDKDGKERYYDSTGNELSRTDVEAAKQQSGRIADYAKTGGVKNVMSSVVKGVSVVGYMDSACTVYNSLRFVSAMSKVIKLAQAARFAQAMVLTPADSIKAGEAKMEDANFVNDNLTTTHPESTVLDESKLDEPGSAKKPATIRDPETGYNAYDSPGYRIAAYGDAPKLSLRASQFMLAGGSTALLDKVVVNIARIVNMGNPNPQVVSQKCRYVQNPAIRFGGFAIGIIAGIGSFGLTTAAGISGSVAVATALPYLESQAADIVAGNLFKDLSGVNAGDAAYVGAAGMFGMMAMNSGAKPLNKKEGMKVLAANQRAYNHYAEVEQFIARDTPFDINNQFSFIGSMVRTIIPTVERSRASVSSAALNVAYLIPQSFSGLLRPARALSADYFDKCNDPAYQSIGIAAGPFCEVRYGLGEEELAIDPLENAQWMADTGNIDPDSETGDAKVNDQPWNYSKFLDQCVHRKVGWGENQDENEGDGRNCIDPAKEEMNRHFRIFTMDQRVDASLDNTSQNIYEPSDGGFTDGQKGAVNNDGWAYPTVITNTIVQGYRTFANPNHMGVSIAGKSDIETRGQPIFAAYSGTVVAAGPNQDYGSWIVIEHNIAGQTMTTVYAHMDDTGIAVRPGQRVNSGDEIGHIGSKGTVDSRPYLYFELWQGKALGDGKRIDPTGYMQAAQRDRGARGV